MRKIYEGDDAKIDSAFTIYYMAVNIGSTISMLLTPWIKDYVNGTTATVGWHAAFAVCCVGLVLGLLNYAVMRRTLGHVGSAPDDAPINWGKLGAGARRRRGAGVRGRPSSCSTRRWRARSCTSPASVMLASSAT